MKVEYLGTNTGQIRWGGNDDPRGCLTIGEIYEVESRKVHSWHTKIVLVGYPGKKFNDASFKYIKNEKGDNEL